MEKNLEKSLKRFLKRKVKITLGFIVAFLLSCNFVWANDIAQMGVFIGQDEKGNIITEGNYSENTFQNGIYTNNSIIKETPLEIGGITGNFGIFTYYLISNNNTLPLSIINNGNINIQSAEDGIGIYNLFNYDWSNKYTAELEIKNNGKISAIGKVSYGIFNDAPFGAVKLKVSSIVNSGIVSAIGTNTGIGLNNNAYNNISISKILNYGIIFGKGENYIGAGVYNSFGININNIFNSGVIKGEGLDKASGIFLSGTDKITSLKNNGFIMGNGQGTHTSGSGEKLKTSGIENGNYIAEILNNGVISGTTQAYSSIGTYAPYGIGIYNLVSSSVIDKIDNNGIILGQGNNKNEDEEDKKLGYGIFNGVTSNTSYKALISDLSNKGIIYGEKNAVLNLRKNENAGSEITTFENYGLLINRVEEGIIVGTDVTNYGMMFTAKDDGTYKLDENNISVENKNVINAKLKDDIKGTESILASDYTDKYINGITDTLKVDKDAEIKNSIINGYTNAIVFADGNHSLTLNDTVVNGGLINISDTESSLGTAILGSGSGENLILSGESTVNGNIDLKVGDDNLTLNNKVQINGTLDGGDGNDTLNFGNDALTFAENEENNLNILHNISNFENINVNNNVTLFENTKVTGASDITIGDNGNLILRIDGTNNNSHALKDNTGIISSNGGKLLFALNGVGEGATIDLGNNQLDETMKGNEIGYAEDITLDTTSLLHNIAKGEGNTVKINTVEDLPEKDIPENINYDKINKIYQSIRSIDKVGEFNIDGEEKLTAFVRYLTDIWAGTPYSYSTEISRKTLTMFDEIAIEKDLNPNLKSWAIYGGLTHTDGGTKDSYYGKGYYTYDVGSLDIEGDTKITGGYTKAEYGKSENFTTGIIFGGNNSEVSLSNGSKLEGDSFYFGVYGKQKIGDFKLTAGIGIQHGDYKADRKALGYGGITDTRDFSENYHDRGFNIYLDGRYSYNLGNNFFMEPKLTFDYNRIQQDEVSEKGDLGIEVDSKILETTSGKVGLDIKKLIQGENFTQELSLGVSYNKFLSGDDKEYLRGRFISGSDFDILINEKADTFSLSTKYEITSENGLSFDIKGSYTFEHENIEDEWTMGVGIGYKF